VLNSLELHIEVDTLDKDTVSFLFAHPVVEAVEVSGQRVVHNGIARAKDMVCGRFLMRSRKGIITYVFTFSLKANINSRILRRNPIVMPDKVNLHLLRGPLEREQVTLTKHLLPLVIGPAVFETRKVENLLSKWIDLEYLRGMRHHRLRILLIRLLRRTILVFQSVLPLLLSMSDHLDSIWIKAHLLPCPNKGRKLVWFLCLCRRSARGPITPLLWHLIDDLLLLDASEANHEVFLLHLRPQWRNLLIDATKGYFILSHVSIPFVRSYDGSVKIFSLRFVVHSVVLTDRHVVETSPILLILHVL
jgi:hypothetical protein